jgi:hypothetical protein
MLPSAAVAALIFGLAGSVTGDRRRHIGGRDHGLRGSGGSRVRWALSVLAFVYSGIIRARAEQLEMSDLPIRLQYY